MNAEFLTPLPEAGALRDALVQWRLWHMVVEHFVFPVSEPVTIENHWQAARSGLAALRDKSDGEYASPWVKIDWEKLRLEKTQKWLTQSFFGRGIDADTRILYLLRNVEKYARYDLTTGERLSDDLTESEILRLKAGGFVGGEDYFGAMTQPPYGIDAMRNQPREGFTNEDTFRETRNEKISKAFSNLCNALWGELDSLEIYGWPTNCSNYFDAGNEWWGSQFWTVYSPTHNWIVTVISSATD